MSGFGGGKWLIAAAVILVGLILFVAMGLQAPTVQQENAAAMLTLIAAGAVAIERVIEALWVVVGLSGKPWWPFTKAGNRLQDMVNKLDENLGPIRDEARKLVGAVGTGAEQAKKLADQFPNLNQADWLVDNLYQLGPDNRRARDMAKAASISAAWFKEHDYEGKREEIKDAAIRVQYTANALTNFLNTFNDNPGRRLISLCLGSIIGVAVAGFLGLDAFQATLGTTPPFVIGIFPNVGTAITGIVIGLGASPTHELIKTLQETKQRRRSA